MIEKHWKEGLARRFGVAAERYEQNSEVQQNSAKILAELIKKHLSSHRPLRILEIGCGTGYLTRRLLPFFSKSEWVVTDISSDMIKICQHNISLENNVKATEIHFKVMDGETPDLSGSFDLICSNMAFQWFHDLKGSVEKLVTLLAPEGLLAFTTLDTGTFDCWNRCQQEMAIHRRGPHFVDVTTLWSNTDQYSVDIHRQTFLQLHNSALDFLRSLKEIGAHSSGLGQTPIAPGQLRSLMKKYESCFTDGTVEANYEIAFVLCSNKLPQQV
ncbi:methyltransferase [Kiloniella laminariae]|uniref:Methyltransferase n=1 Tax=Kiloniella laminariae TaxID=454162 RepID=A0ABT4LM12_9PROT|nr:methyltransferase [Kiloniella laminariae]MCZ4282142.1 methyltransferase [Kiloniella laminariae]